MGDILDKETKQFLLVLAGILVFVMFIYPRMNSSVGSTSLFANPVQALSNNTSSTGSKSTSGSTVTRQIKFDNRKDYIAQVETSAGSFTIDLLEKNAPVNVGSMVNQVSRYTNSPIQTQKDFLFKIDAKSDIKNSTVDEINPDSLGLSNRLVSEVNYLKDLYDPTDPATRYFAPENLERYGDFTLKEMYEEILDYEFKYDVETPEAKKYMVYMTSTGPNTNKSDFFILMSDAVGNVNGRYTPIGQVVEGFEVLDEINSANSGSITVNKVTVTTK